VSAETGAGLEWRLVKVGGASLIRVVVLFAVTAAPLAIGAIHPEAWVPFLVLAYAGGIASWARARMARALGHQDPEVPGWRALLALHLLVVVQLLPLPPGLLARVSPGSFAAYCIGVPEGLASGWFPITVDPPDTLRGLVFLGGMSLLYATVFREFRQERWRRRLCGALVGAGMFLTLAALVQAVSAQPTRIYGVWTPSPDWAVFGPYVNRNHLAGFLAVVAPLGLAFAFESVLAAVREWRRRGFWATLGAQTGSAALLRPAAAAFVLVGLLASGSRGGFVAFVASLPVFLLMSRQRLRVALVVVPLALLAIGTVDMNPMLKGFETRGFNRWEAWADMLSLVEFFPVLGVGFNAFGSAYWPYQTFQRQEFWGEAHNEYLQILFDTGLVGVAIASFLAARLVRAALRSVGRGAVRGGVVAALAASGVHAVVSFNWQIPANAAAVVALCALAVHHTAADVQREGSK